MPRQVNFSRQRLPCSIYAQSKGISYDVPSGRRDGRVSLSSDTFTNLPAPSSSLDQLTREFAKKGLTEEDLVTLSGVYNSDGQPTNIDS